LHESLLYGGEVLCWWNGGKIGFWCLGHHASAPNHAPGACSARGAQTSGVSLSTFVHRNMRFITSTKDIVAPLLTVAPQFQSRVHTVFDRNVMYNGKRAAVAMFPKPVGSQRPDSKDGGDLEPTFYQGPFPSHLLLFPSAIHSFLSFSCSCFFCQPVSVVVHFP
jgi:hypothetical protein